MQKINLLVRDSDISAISSMSEEQIRALIGDYENELKNSEYTDSVAEISKKRENVIVMNNFMKNIIHSHIIQNLLPKLYAELGRRTVCKK